VGAVKFKFRTMNTVKERIDSKDKDESVPQMVAVNEMVRASDVDLLAGDIAAVRMGYRKILDGAHSLWSNGDVCFFVRTSVLYQLHDDLGGATALATLRTDAPADFADVNGAIAYTNGTDIGWITDTGAEPFAAPKNFRRFTTTVGSVIEVPNSLEPLPAGQLITLYNATLCVACGSTLVRSRPYNLEAVHRVGGYTTFDSPLTMLKAVDDGIWVSTGSQLLFISQDEDPIPQDPYVAIPGTAVMSKGELFAGGKMKGHVVWWMSPQGVCVGGNSGELYVLSEQKVIVAPGLQGAALFRDLDGQRHYISTVNGA
jgi:hypothetical protein